MDSRASYATPVGSASNVSPTPTGAPSPPVIDRNITLLLDKHHQSNLTTDSVLHCAPLLSDIVGAIDDDLAIGDEGPRTVSLLSFIVATCATSQHCAPADMQPLTAPVNSASMRPLALLVAPSVVRSLLHAQATELVFGGPPLLSQRDGSNTTAASSDAPPSKDNKGSGGAPASMRSALLFRVYQSMRSAAARNQNILATDCLPFPVVLEPIPTSSAGNSGATSGAASPATVTSASGSGGGALGEPSGRHRPTSLTPSALRDRIVMASVFQCPPFQEGVTHENVGVVVYTVLCACAYLLHNLIHTRDLGIVGATSRYAASICELLKDTQFWNLARRDAALSAVTASLLQLCATFFGTTPSLTANNQTSVPGSGPTCLGGAVSVEAAWRSAVDLWTEECFSHAEHTQAALALMPFV